MKNKLTLFLLIFCLLVSTTVGAQIRKFERSTPEAEGVPSGALIALMDSLMGLPKTDIHSVMVLRHGKVIAEAYAFWKSFFTTKNDEIGIDTG